MSGLCGEFDINSSQHHNSYYSSRNPPKDVIHDQYSDLFTITLISAEFIVAEKKETLTMKKG